MFVNGLPFFVTTSRNIKFNTVEHMNNMSKTNIYKCIESVINLYHKRGFQINTVLGDEQFDVISEQLQQNFNINFNPASAFEHIGDIKRMIRTIKERIRAAMSSYPWKKSIPKLITKETVKHIVKMINAFPPKSGITTKLSPRNIITGKSLNYKHHFKIPLGDYVQVHEEEQPRNSMAERTLGAICLGPLDNAGWIQVHESEIR